MCPNCSSSIKTMPLGCKINDAAQGFNDAGDGVGAYRF